jgi:hypothetical protein
MHIESLENPEEANELLTEYQLMEEEMHARTDQTLTSQLAKFEMMKVNI